MQSPLVSQCNVRERSNTDEETWPPDQPENFTPLVLIHHQGQHTMKQAIYTAMAQLIQTDDIDEITLLASNQSVPKYHPKLDSHEPLQKVLDSSTVTKEFAEILAPLEQSKDLQFILIEGAAGSYRKIKELARGNKQLSNTLILRLFCNRGDTRGTQMATILAVIIPCTKWWQRYCLYL